MVRQGLDHTPTVADRQITWVDRLPQRLRPFAVLARWAVAPHLESGALKAVRLTREGYHRQWAAALVRQPNPPPFIGAFAELLAAGPAMLDKGRPAA